MSLQILSAFLTRGNDVTGNQDDYYPKQLQSTNFLVGNQFIETNIRLFTTLVRFDSVYFGNFKCNIKQLIDYPNLRAYTKIIYNIPDISETVNFDHIE